MSGMEIEDESGTIEIDFEEFLHPKKTVKEANDFVKINTTKRHLKEQNQKLKDVFK